MKIHVTLAILAASCSAAFSISLPVSEDTSSTAGRSGFTISAVSGRAATLAVSPKNKAFLYFDLDGLPTTATAANVISARLRLYIGTVRKPGTIELREATADWKEDQIKSVAEPGVVVAGQPIAQIQNMIRKRFVIVDVTATVKNWLANPASNHGFAIVAPAGQTTSVLLGAKEGSGSGYPAELEIDTNPIVPLFTDGDPTSGLLNGAKIATGTISSLQLGAGSVGSSALVAEGVGTLNLADGSVTAPKLAAGAVVNSISDGTITSAKLADGSVTLAKLAPDAVSPNSSISVPAVRVTGSVTQTLVSNAENVLQWNVEIYDAVDSHSNSVNNSRLYASLRGIYLVHITESMQPSGFAQYTLSLWKNGVSTGIRVSDAPIGSLSSSAYKVAASQLVQMNAGDFIEVSANAGGGLDRTVDRSQNSFAMVFLAPLP